MKQTLIIIASLLTGLLTWAQGKVGVDAQGDSIPPGALARLGTLRFRHDAPITCQAVSNDGRLIATGGGRTVRVWEAATGRQLFVLTISQNSRAAAPSAVAFSPDGQLLAALGAYGQGMVTVWDLRGGQARQELTLQQREDYTNTLMDAPFLAFVGNNRKQILVKNYSDRSIRQIDLDSGQDVHSYRDIFAGLNAIAISQDGNWLAAGTSNREVILWDLKQGKETNRLLHGYPLVALAFSRDGQFLATLDEDLAPKVWNLATGKEHLSFHPRTRSIALSWSLDDQSLYVARQSDQLVRWNLKSKQEQTFALPRGWVTGPVFSSKTSTDTEAIIIGSPGRRGTNSARLRYFELSQLNEATKFDGYESGSVFPIHLAHRKQWATIGTTGDDTLRIWDAQGKVVLAIKLPVADQTFRSFASGPEGKLIALSCTDGRILIVDTLTGKLQRTITAFNRACYDTSISADGQTLIVTDLRHVKVYQISTGTELKNYELSSIDSMRTVISTDGSRIASMAYQQEDEQINLRILDARTGKVLSQDNKLLVQQQNYYYSPDGRNLVVLASRGRTGGITIVEAGSGKVRFQADPPTPYAYLGSHARISPDGRWLAVSASGPEAEQYAAIAWRLGEKRDPVIFQGHRGAVLSVNFSSDSKQLLTTSTDTSMLVWDLQRHPAVTPLPLDEKGLAKLWQDLGDQDAAKAFTAIHHLARYEKSADWLIRQILDKTTTIQPDLIKNWINQLNAVKFSEREEATKQLIRHAAIARAQLKAAIEQTDSAETKRRLEQILEQARETTGLSENPLQYSRAIEALELLATPASLQHLQKLSERKDALGQDAHDALIRLKHRVKSGL